LNDVATGNIYEHVFVVGVLKGIPALFLFFLLYRFARQREVAWFDDALRGETALVTSEELAALHTMRGRRAACQAGWKVAGARGARMLRQLQQAQVRLAVATARTGDPTSAAVEEARADVRVARGVLVSASVEPAPATSPADPAGDR
jgi:hypothetical protein